MTDLLPYSKVALKPLRYLSDVITITSATGVGSSSTLKALQARLGMPWRFVSGGALMRTFAKQRGMTIDEFAAHNRAHPEEGWDRKLDDMLAGFGRQNFTVIESRLAHSFVPHRVHLLLSCDPAIRTHRRMRDTGEDFETTLARILRRDDDDDGRYAKLYPGCLWPVADFDVVLDTAKYAVDDVCLQICEAHSTWKSGRQGLLWEGLLYEPVFD